MKIGMEGSEMESVAEEVGNDMGGEYAGVEALGAEAGNGCLVLLFDHAKILSQAGALEVFERQNPGGGQFPIDFGNPFRGRSYCVVAQELAMRRFTPVVELIARPSRILYD